jgi:hypothetical protein
MSEIPMKYKTKADYIKENLQYTKHTQTYTLYKTHPDIHTVQNTPRHTHYTKHTQTYTLYKTHPDIHTVQNTPRHTHCTKHTQTVQNTPRHTHCTNHTQTFIQRTRHVYVHTNLDNCHRKTVLAQPSALLSPLCWNSNCADCQNGAKKLPRGTPGQDPNRPLKHSLSPHFFSSHLIYLL